MKIDPSKIKVITFDLGNVLLPFSRWRAVFNIADASGSSPFKIAFYFLTSGVWQGFDSGHYTVTEFYEKVKKDLGLNISEKDFCYAYADIFKEHHKVTSLLPLLKKRYKLFVLSDINPLHKKYLLERHPFFSNFDHFIASYEVKAKKPSPKMFDQVLRRAGVSPHETIFIDDKPCNVSGARRHGIHALRFRSERQFLSDFKRLGFID